VIDREGSSYYYSAVQVSMVSMVGTYGAHCEAHIRLEIGIEIGLDFDQSKQSSLNLRLDFFLLIG